MAATLATTNECATRMRKELPEGFAALIAHGTHSLSRQDIQYYFPSEKKEFNLPTVNPDLLSKTSILSQPIDFQHSWQSPALRLIDQILTHMDSTSYDEKDATPLERILHASHMQDWWFEGSKAYSKLQVSFFETNVSSIGSTETKYIKLRPKFLLLFFKFSTHFLLF